VLIFHEALRARAFEEASAKGSLTGPLIGIKSVPLVGLEEAISSLQNGPQEMIFKSLNSLEAVAVSLKNGSLKLTSGKYPNMTADEAAAIYLYTMQTPLYAAMNAALREEDTDTIAPFLKYIKLLLNALYKLPIERHTVYRGIRDPPDYHDHELLVWWSFSSATRRVHVTESFLNFSGPRAKLIIENVPCVNIEEFSALRGEFERLLLPGTSLKVLSQTKFQADGSRDVQVEFIKGHVMFDFMHPQWSIDLLGTPGRFSSFLSLFEDSIIYYFDLCDVICLRLSMFCVRLRVITLRSIQVGHAAG
jgi:hypothetical protein